MQRSILSTIRPSFRKAGTLMLSKPSFQMFRQTKSQTFIAMQKALRLVKNKYLAAVGIGMLGNLLVNVFFNLKYQRGIWSMDPLESYLAIAVTLVLLSINQGLTGTFKRWFGKQPVRWKYAFLASSTLSLNLLVIGITYIFYHSFYSLADLLIINFVFVPIITISSWRLKKEFITKLTAEGSWMQWKWVSSVLLGICTNTLINLIFDYKFQRNPVSISLEEYLNAIVAAHILLNGTRWIGRKLDTRFPWKDGVVKRLVWQIGTQLVFLIVSLNFLLISITYLLYEGGYAMDELLIINLSLIMLTILFSGIDTSIYFFKNSQSDTGKHLPQLERKPIMVTLGKSKHLVNQNEINFALSQSGLTLIVTKDGRKLPYSQSLEQLYTNLDHSCFFKVNRQVVINRCLVKAYKTLAYGKLALEVNTQELDPSQVHISRTRATEFRKWLNNQSC